MTDHPHQREDTMTTEPTPSDDELFARAVDRWRAMSDGQRQVLRDLVAPGTRLLHTPDPDDRFDWGDGEGAHPVQLVAEQAEIVALPGGYTVDELDSGRLAEWDEDQ